MAALQHLLRAVSARHQLRVLAGVQGDPTREAGECGVGICVEADSIRLCSWYVACFSLLLGEALANSRVVAGSYVLFTHMMAQRRKIMRGTRAAQAVDKKQ